MNLRWISRSYSKIPDLREIKLFHEGVEGHQNPLIKVFFIPYSGLSNSGRAQRSFIDSRPTHGMLALRYFVCQQCEAVYAELGSPPNCECGSVDSMKEITADVQTEPYLTQLLRADQ